MNSRRVVPCLGALISALLVSTAGASAASTAPVVKSISPTKLKVGEKLTVKGSGFIAGKGKTRVFFVRSGGGTAFARADSATKTKFVVTVPAQLDKVLNGKTSRIRIRVLTKKFGALTPTKKSPIVSPSGGDPSTPDSGPAGPNGDCDKDKILNKDETDKDNDLLSNDAEKKLGLDPCAADTDLDGVGDGYEYQSALDLNRTVLFGSRPPTPYPGKRPYPNPLFVDAEIDFDGDGLSLAQEALLWKTFGAHTLALNYSDGLQTTVPTPLPPDPLAQQLDSAAFGDHYNDGQLDDAERDADGDGLSNWDEANGRMNESWWNEIYKDEPEKTYALRHFPSTDMIDPDTDGDGIKDGADDQDNDGLSNAFEVARPYNWRTTYVSVNHSGTNPYARVQPFNPCKPVFAGTCHRHPPIGYYQDEDWQGISPAAAGPPNVTPGPLFAP